MSIRSNRHRNQAINLFRGQLRPPALLILCLWPLLAKASNDSPPVDAATALAALAKLEAAHLETGAQLRQKAAQTLRQGAAGGSAAARLYEEALGGTGQPDMSGWKRTNADLLRSKPFQEAAQMHLRYLLLSLDRGSSDDAARWSEPSLQYARDLSRLLADKSLRQSPGPARELLGKPVAEGPFVRWLRLGPLLPPSDQWEPAPGNLGGILEKNVRTPWRQASDPRVDAAWQLELETGVALADADGSERAVQDFNTRAAPALLFRRALDRGATGQPNRAAADLLDLARRHPDHPDFPQWAAVLRKMLEGNTTPARTP